MSYGDQPPPGQGESGGQPPPGSGGYPPPGSGAYPPGPTEGQGGQPPGQGFPPPGQSYPPPNTGYPAPNAGYPAPNQGGGYPGGQDPPGGYQGATTYGEPSPGRSKLPLIIGLVVAALLIGVAVVVFALRGDEDADNTATEPETTVESSEPTTESTTEPTEATEDPTTEPTEDATTEPTEDPTTEPAEGDDAAYCAQMGELQTRFTEFNTGTVTNEQLASMVSGLEDLQAVAPDEVSGDIGSLLSGFDALQAVLDDLGITFEDMQDPAVLQEEAASWTPQQLKSLQKLNTELNGTDFQAAGDALDQDYTARC